MGELQECLDNLVGHPDELRTVNEAIDKKIELQELDAALPADADHVTEPGSVQGAVTTTLQLSSSMTRVLKLEIHKLNKDVRSWKKLWNRFEWTSHKNSALHPIDRFQYLTSYLIGQRAAAVDVLPLMHNLHDTEGLPTLYDDLHTGVLSLEAGGVASSIYGRQRATAEVVHEDELEDFPNCLKTEVESRERAQRAVRPVPDTSIKPKPPIERDDRPQQPSAYALTAKMLHRQVGLEASLQIEKKTCAKPRMLLLTTRAYADGQDKDPFTRILLDDGSQRTFKQEEASSRLMLRVIGTERLAIYASCQGVNAGCETGAANIAREQGIELADTLPYGYHSGVGVDLLIGAYCYLNTATARVKRLDGVARGCGDGVWVGLTRKDATSSAASYVVSVGVMRLENFGITDDAKITAEDDNVFMAFDDAIVCKNGRYEVGLPWKENASHLIDNNNTASQRLQSFILKLLRNEEIICEYDQATRSYLQA
ncbi:hypothetical protein HPB50_008357 [Hyalomma asiaticum]|uniref:Uncharacterized protein n=1 Tax=Hyalomma asiaticum TaxID=266040 RepID=A0ACB7TCZ9_HYAAI|nr:hypothetical protein HPB50_008357 [Hyalomma asiaticum]